MVTSVRVRGRFGEGVPARRYLQPEPLLQAPEYSARLARLGRSVPAYAYAHNNPIFFTDSTGAATIRLCTFNIAGINPLQSKKGSTSFNMGADLRCGGDNGAELTITVTNDCSTSLKGAAGDAVFGQGARPTTYEEVVRHEQEHISDLNSCLSAWVLRHAGDEGNYCTRAACLKKANELAADLDRTTDRCGRESQCRLGDRTCN